MFLYPKLAFTILSLVLKASTLYAQWPCCSYRAVVRSVRVATSGRLSGISGASSFRTEESAFRKPSHMLHFSVTHDVMSVNVSMGKCVVQRVVSFICRPQLRISRVDDHCIVKYQPQS